MRARKHQRLAGSLSEAGDSSMLEPDRGESIVFRRMAQRECRERVGALPRLAQRVVARELHGVPVDEIELLFVLELGLHAAHSAAGTEDLFLERKVKIGD